MTGANSGDREATTLENSAWKLTCILFRRFNTKSIVSENMNTIIMTQITITVTK